MSKFYNIPNINIVLVCITMCYSCKVAWNSFFSDARKSQLDSVNLSFCIQGKSRILGT